MRGRFFYIVASVGMLIILIAIILCLMYTFYGSLEIFPTEGQHDKVRIVFGSISLLLIVLEFILYFVRRHLRMRG